MLKGEEDRNRERKKSGLQGRFNCNVNWMVFALICLARNSLRRMVAERAKTFGNLQEGGIPY